MKGKRHFHFSPLDTQRFLKHCQPDATNPPSKEILIQLLSIRRGVIAQVNKKCAQVNKLCDCVLSFPYQKHNACLSLSCECCAAPVFPLMWTCLCSSKRIISSSRRTRQRRLGAHTSSGTSLSVSILL